MASIMIPKKIREIRVGKALSRSKLHDLDYSLNPYLGCSIGCIYCYAPKFTGDREASTFWGDVVVVKVNLIDVLSREVLTYRKGVVGLSIITDPYISIEASYKLSRRSLEILLSRGFKVSIHTKSPLVLRDLDVIARYRKSVDVGITITTINHDLAKVLEPKAPHPRSRMMAGGKIVKEGVETWFFLGPIIPGVNDSIDHYLEVIEYSSHNDIEIYYSVFNPYDVSLNMISRGMDSSIIEVIRDKLKKRSWWKSFKEEIDRYCIRYRAKCYEWLKNQPYRYVALDAFYRD